MAQTRAESELLQKEANEILLAEKDVVSQLKREMTALNNEIEILNETLVSLKAELAEGSHTVSTTLPSTPPCCLALTGMHLHFILFSSLLCFTLRYDRCHQL